jgi:L-fucose isomerase
MDSIGIISFSDGRKRVHDGLAPYIKDVEDRLATAIEAGGEFTAVRGGEVVWNVDLAAAAALRLLGAGVAGIVLNVPVFAFPNFALVAALKGLGPYLAIAPANGKLPGLGGLLASSNLLTQNGIPCGKAWGSPEEPEIALRLRTFCRSARAVSALKGSVYGLFGGRSIGMGTGAANPDLWVRTFGVDTEHVDQLEIIRRAGLVPPEKIEAAFRWISDRVGVIHYDGDKLTPETLKTQVACHIALKEIAEERRMDFIGVKCHYELSEFQVTQCVSAALMNDPYDWDGPKEPTVFSCEADSDGALTMQIMKLVSGKPTMFVDFRHLDREAGVFSFCNCGAFATWYAHRDPAPEKNLREVSLHALIPKYAGKGCHVQFMAGEGPMTFGRLTHSGDAYVFTVFRGDIVRMPPEKLEETCPQWPHAFVRPSCDPGLLIDRWVNNHVHGIPGDYVDELREASRMLGIAFDLVE